LFQFCFVIKDFFCSGVKAEEKKGGAGKGNWGTMEDDIEAKVFRPL